MEIPQSKVHDITLTISPDLPLWPGDTETTLERVLKIENGDGANVTRMSMSAHTGTHVDAPCHFLPRGDSVDQLSLDILIGAAEVIEVPEADHLSAEIFRQAKLSQGAKRVLFKTRNSKKWIKDSTEFCHDYAAITADGAEYLVERGIRLVGVDYLSVAPFAAIVPTHEILLKAGVIIVEGLNLSGVNAGDYTLYCLPLKIAHADGAPARAVLVENLSQEKIVNKTKIVLKIGDITREKVDMIVNAANSRLLGGGGVDGAIHHAGGPSIFEECKKIRESRGRCPTGDAVITTGGNLAATHVVHAAGPIWRGGGQQEEEQLRNAYRNSLRLAMENGGKTIAFPSISTGAYGFPIEKAAPIALKTVCDFAEEYPVFDEVRFVLFVDADYQTYARALRQL
ncbi:MAG: O-acetyl-ADP-ribose deacetylase [Waddliaceae bacterium]